MTRLSRSHVLTQSSGIAGRRLLISLSLVFMLVGATATPVMATTVTTVSQSTSVNASNGHSHSGFSVTEHKAGVDSRVGKVKAKKKRGGFGRFLRGLGFFGALLCCLGPVVAIIIAVAIMSKRRKRTY